MSYIVLTTPLPRKLLSNLHKDLMPRAASDIFKILAYSELCLRKYIQAYSSIFNIKTY